ncbi:hypothetical protein Dsin_018308 [Dipteronia sinensis]|uniref:Uncharacterized protein n=1 Tax=Dipteronia sinensis TaxID=43782 RepID=A0AAE0A5N9_9ROSI|nr:hypothetical protein Dsin_018308 [Dipteronia sinensis]
MVGLNNCFIVDRIGRGGGLMFLWKDWLDVSVKSFTIGHIDAMVREEDNNCWSFTGFYGEPYQSQKSVSWAFLHRLRGMDRLPWLVVGYFNKIISSGEKSERLCKRSSAIEAFREVVDDCGLIDMGFQGSQFTWTNRRLR